MSFQPVIPLGGYAGWRFLERTLENQKTAFTESASVTRATDYFRERIGQVSNAEELVNNRQLLTVALGAFGLDEDIDNSFFIRKILEEGTIANDALANRLADTRYADFSKAFGFGDRVIPRTSLSQFPSEIIERYEVRQFERAVGQQDNNLRLALNVETAVGDIVDRTSSTNAQWFSIMGNPPLRQVFETAFGLPSSIGSIDLDRQLELFRDRSEALLGTDDVGELMQENLLEKLIRLFLVRSDAASIGFASGGATALTLLNSAARFRG